MPAKRVLIGFGVDVDAVAGWLGSYGGEDSPLDISRGMYAGEVGVPRLLNLFKKYGIKTTWFVPGHSLETFPEQMQKVRDAGHELGLHGYSHENPVAMTVQQQKDILEHTHNLLTEFNFGVPPKGSVAPWWETSKEGTELLLDKGIEYDHSSMAHDCQAYYMRDADSWTKIDYSAKAETWMKPLRKGNETGLVCIPANWYLDDLPPMMFIKSSSNSHGWVNSRDVEQLWKDTFSYCYREEEEFIFPITIHPDVSGRPHVLLMLERFIEWVNRHENVQWVPMIEMARDFRLKKKPTPGAKMPAGYKQDI
ncbi:glycoside hydrolase/deacetylase [Gymnopilus junonius]|uniref:Glycoside hydrolase/deacetylase n=1 Tax=Gymnopilus junonius TaxID=109634 RepID=A0A9P5NY03_GYMJU|nr:glycoside hydrolase/deacetylase [Gymnopilus junonius]